MPTTRQQSAGPSTPSRALNTPISKRAGSSARRSTSRTPSQAHSTATHTHHRSADEVAIEEAEQILHPQIHSHPGHHRTADEIALEEAESLLDGIVATPTGTRPGRRRSNSAVGEGSSTSTPRGGSRVLCGSRGRGEVSVELPSLGVELRKQYAPMSSKLPSASSGRDTEEAVPDQAESTQTESSGTGVETSSSTISAREGIHENGVIDALDSSHADSGVAAGGSNSREEERAESPESRLEAEGQDADEDDDEEYGDNHTMESQESEDEVQEARPHTAKDVSVSTSNGGHPALISAVPLSQSSTSAGAIVVADDTDDAVSTSSISKSDADASTDDSDTTDTSSESDSDEDEDDTTSNSESESDSDEEVEDEEEERLEKLLAAAKLSARKSAINKTDDNMVSLTGDVMGEQDVLRLDADDEPTDAPIPRMTISGLPAPAIRYGEDGIPSAGPSRPRPTAKPSMGRERAASATASSAGQSKDGPVPELDNRAYERPLSKREKANQPKKATPTELWSTLPSTRADLLPQMRRDYQALALANSMDPKRFMKGGQKVNKVPENFAIGTVVEQPRHLQASTMAREQKYRPGQLVQDVVADAGVSDYAKRKFGDLQWKRMENGRGKGWKKRTKW